MNSTNPLCVVTGVGESTGISIVRRFIDGGYRVAMIARNESRLNKLANDMEGTYPYPCDVGDIENLNRTLAEINDNLGSPNVLVHNAVSASFQNFLDSNPEDLEKNFRVNTTSLLYLSRALAPEMIEQGNGAILVTGNTAAYRGVPDYALFAPTKAAQRILTESLARHLGPKGIHVAYISIDAAIDTPWLKERKVKPKSILPPSDWKNNEEDYFSKPGDIAEEIYHIAHQNRSTWAFDIVLRPYCETW